MRESEKRTNNKNVYIISDKGPENKTLSKFKHKFSKKICFLLARTDIRQSNSMVEAFFKSLKNNYLYFQKLENIREAKRCIQFYIDQHNNLPLATYKGASPSEVRDQSWSQLHIDSLDQKKKVAIDNRKKLIPPNKCKSCFI